MESHNPAKSEEGSYYPCTLNQRQEQLYKPGGVRRSHRQMPSERSSDLPNPWRGGHNQLPSNPSGREPGNYILNSLPSLTLLLALPLTESTRNQGVKEPVDIVWTELPPRREKRPTREGGWASKQKLSIPGLIHH